MDLGHAPKRIASAWGNGLVALDLHRLGGKESSTDIQTAAWLDDVHDWQTISSGDLRLHWYDNDKAFAQTMLDAGSKVCAATRSRRG